jgi:hypothetical protein
MRRAHFHRAHRLHQIVVGAGVEAGLDILGLAAHGHENHIEGRALSGLELAA